MYKYVLTMQCIRNRVCNNKLNCRIYKKKKHENMQTYLGHELYNYFA